MATSAYSTPNQSYNIGGFESIDYTGEVQRAIQGKIDVNKEKANEVMKKFAAVDLIRDSDKEAFTNKLMGIVKYMNGSEGLDFRDNSLVSALDAELSKAFDSETMKQIGYTREVRKFNALIESKKAEGKGKYNQANEWFSKNRAGYDAYMKGETNDLGALQYSDYVDVYGTFQKDIEKWAKEIGIQTNVQSDAKNAPDVMTIVKSKTLDGERLRSYISGKLENSPEYQQQILINGAYDYKDIKDEDIVNAYRGNLQGKADYYKSIITQYKGAQKGKAEDSEEYLAYEAAIQEAESNMEFAMKAKDVKASRDQYIYSLATEKLSNSLVMTNQKNEITDIKYSDVFAVNRDRQFRQQKDNAYLEIAKQKLAIQKEGLELKKTKAAADSKAADPTMTTVPITKEEEKDSTDAQLRVLANEEKTGLAVALLMKENNIKDEEEAKKMLFGMLSDGSNQQFGMSGKSAELQGYIKDIKEFHVENRKISSEGLDRFMETDLKKWFNTLVEKGHISGAASMVLGEVNPVLTNLYKKAKEEGITYEQLSEKSKVLLASELLSVEAYRKSGNKKTMGKEDGIYHLRKELLNRYPEYAESLEKSGKKVKEAGFWKGLWEGTSNSLVSEGNALSRLIGGMAIGATGNTELAKEFKRKRTESIKESDKAAREGWTNLRRGFTRVALPNSNQGQLTKTQQGGVDNDITDIISTTSQWIDNRINNIASEKADLNFNHRQEFTFDSGTKEYKELRNRIAASGQSISQTEPITVRKDSKGVISGRFLSGSGKNKEVAAFDFNEADSKYVANVISNATANAANIASNPGARMHKEYIDYTMPKNGVELETLKRNLHKYNPYMFNRYYIEDPGAGLITQEEMRSFANLNLKGEASKKEFDSMLGRRYSVKTEHDKLYGPMISVYTTERGKKKKVHTYKTDTGVDLGNLTEDQLYGLLPTAVNQYLQVGLSKILEKELQTK